MGNRARNRRRHVPAAQLQQAEKAGERRGDEDPDAEYDQDDQETDRDDAGIEGIEAEHQAVPSISSLACSSTVLMCGAPTGASAGFMNSRR